MSELFCERDAMESLNMSYDNALPVIFQLKFIGIGNKLGLEDLEVQICF